MLLEWFDECMWLYILMRSTCIYIAYIHQYSLLKDPQHPKLSNITTWMRTLRECKKCMHAHMYDAHMHEAISHLHTIFPISDTEFLLRFLRAAKFSQLRAREILEGYFTLKTRLSHWYDDIDTHNKGLIAFLKTGWVYPCHCKGILSKLITACISREFTWRKSYFLSNMHCTSISLICYANSVM